MESSGNKIFPSEIMVSQVKWKHCLDYFFTYANHMGQLKLINQIHWSLLHPIGEFCPPVATLGQAPAGSVNLLKSAPAIFLVQICMDWWWQIKPGKGAWIPWMLLLLNLPPSLAWFVHLTIPAIAVFLLPPLPLPCNLLGEASKVFYCWSYLLIALAAADPCAPPYHILQQLEYSLCHQYGYSSGNGHH